MTLAFDYPQAKPNRHGEWGVREGPADTLQLTIGQTPSPDYQPTWSDGPDAKLEARLTEMVVEIIVAGEVAHRASCVRHHQWILEHREELRARLRKQREDAERRAREQRIAEQKAQREHLFAQAHAWRTARDIRGFVGEVLARPPVQPASETEAWAAWALAEADALDPVASGDLRPPPEAPAPPSSNPPSDNA